MSQPCRKISYLDRFEAECALITARGKRELRGHWHVEQRVYDCPYCGFWHLTSQPTRARAQEPRRREDTDASR